MPCPSKNLGRLKAPEEGSLSWYQAYLFYPAVVLGGLIGVVFVQQFAVDLYAKLFRDKEQ